MAETETSDRTVVASDGTRLACRETGRGPLMMLANGLGGTWPAWRHLIRHFRSFYRIVSWDYRGLYASGPSAVPGAYDMDTQVRDALAVLESTGERDAVWVGWSMGVQLCIELTRQAPERVRGLVLINGAFGRPFDSALGWKGSRVALPAVAKAARCLPGPLSFLSRRLGRSLFTLRAMQALGLAGRTLDEEVFRDLARDFGTLDWEAYFSTFLALGEHDGEAALGGIRCPVLIVAGDRDPMTPRALSERMRGAIAGAELLRVPGGTHYVPVEFPELVNLRLERFLAERGLLPGVGGGPEAT